MHEAQNFVALVKWFGLILIADALTLCVQRDYLIEAIQNIQGRTLWTKLRWNLTTSSSFPQSYSIIFILREHFSNVVSCHSNSKRAIFITGKSHNSVLYSIKITQLLSSPLSNEWIKILLNFNTSAHDCLCYQNQISYQQLKNFFDATTKIFEAACIYISITLWGLASYL